MVKSLQSQFRDIERNMVREMNKMVKRANKKINPVILPTQVDSSMSALNFNEYHQDNSTHVSVNGDLINSQIGGQNNTLNITYTDMEIEKIFENIKEYSRTLDEEEKTEFTVTLKGLSDPGKKIGVIKEVRNVIPGLGLKEAKELVEGAPKVLKEDVSKEEAAKIKEAITAAGGEVEIA